MPQKPKRMYLVTWLLFWPKGQSFLAIFQRTPADFPRKDHIWCFLHDSCPVVNGALNNIDHSVAKTSKDQPRDESLRFVSKAQHFH